MSEVVWREPIRRNAIRRDDLPAMAVTSAAAAAAASFAGAHPTGAPVVDGLLVVLLAGGTVWLAASASWWVLVAAGAIASAAAGTVLGVVVSIIAIAIALWLGSVRRSLVPLRCISAALIVQVLLRLDVDPFFGASAAIAGIAFLLLLGVSAQRRRPRVRRLLARSLLAAIGLALLAAIGFGAAAASARSDLTTGYDGVLDGLSLLQSGDVRLAATALHDAAAALDDADDSMSAPWSQPARLLPVVAQHRNALASIVAQSAGSTEAAANALDVLDLDALTIDGGVIDVDAVAALEEPLAELQDAVDALSAALDGADSPWLIGPARERLTRYRARADKAAVQARATATAAARGPAMLGDDELRRYFIAFCTPAEARGAGGVMGNYAVITIDDGRIERTAFGRTTQLVDELGAHGNVPVTVEPGFADRYLRFGLEPGDTEGTYVATPAMWSNATMTPDVPSAASVLRQMWEGTGHEPLDGVFIIDPSGLAALLRSTGAITVPDPAGGTPIRLDSTNLEQFLLLEQYQIDTPARSDLLEQVAQATLTAILGGQLPGPQVLARDLGPAATTGHLSGWALAPEEQQLLQAIGMDAALPPLDGRDGLAVVTNNASANKIDTFLLRTIRYDATVRNGVETATLTVTLRNTAPAAGYPDYVLGSEFLDLPSGTNRTLLTVYTPLDYTSAALDGEPVSLTTDEELGWRAYTLVLDLAPGQERTIALSLAGRVTGEYALVLRPQPMAHDDAVSVTVDGDVQISWSGRATRRTVIDERGARALR